MSEPRSTQAVFQTLEAVLELVWIAGRAGSGRLLLSAAVGGSRLVGLLNWVYPPQVQLLGRDELHFLADLHPAVRGALLERLFAAPTAAVVICTQRSEAEDLRAAADAAAVPLWYTPLAPEVVMDKCREYEYQLGGSDPVHGELLEVFGLGVLITGASGIGKSELALELLSRGHRLIADDTPALIRMAADIVEGTCPPVLRDFLEVRGLGVLNVRRMFGDSAIKRNKRIRLIINLVRAEALHGEDRLAGTRQVRELLGVSVPVLELPIAPGRNLAVLVECAVRDHIQRLNGHRADEDLQARLRAALLGEAPCE